jgi:DNA-binding CsgD family transcriptional regulator
MLEHQSYASTVLLTPRESQILGLLCEGVEGRRAIATQLQISMNTVAFHLKSIYSKLGVGSRDDAVKAAARSLGIAQRPAAAMPRNEDALRISPA